MENREGEKRIFKSFSPSLLPFAKIALMCKLNLQQLSSLVKRNLFKQAMNLLA